VGEGKRLNAPTALRRRKGRKGSGLAGGGRKDHTIYGPVFRRRKEGKERGTPRLCRNHLGRGGKKEEREGKERDLRKRGGKKKSILYSSKRKRKNFFQCILCTSEKKKKKAGKGRPGGRKKEGKGKQEKSTSVLSKKNQGKGTLCQSPRRA